MVIVFVSEASDICIRSLFPLFIFCQSMGCYHTAQRSSGYSFLRNNFLGQAVPVDYTQVGCWNFFLFKLSNCLSVSCIRFVSWLDDLTLIYGRNDSRDQWDLYLASKFLGKRNSTEEKPLLLWEYKRTFVCLAYPYYLWLATWTPDINVDVLLSGWRKEKDMSQINESSLCLS